MSKFANLLIITALCWTASFSQAADWPGFRGPGRLGKSAETGLLKKWPDAGPKLIFSTKDLGQGWSSAAIDNGKIFITGMVEKEGFVSALDMDGNILWKKSYGPEWSRSWQAARSIPTIDGDKLYVTSGAGSISCFEVKTGKKIWTVDYTEKFQAKPPRFGFAESALVVGNKVICTPGGPKGSVVALDKLTGKVIWANTEVIEGSAYCSAQLVELPNKKLAVTMLVKSTVAIDVETGKLVWKDAVVGSGGRANHPVTPIFQDGHLYVTAGYDKGGVLYKLTDPAGKFTQLWSDQVLDNHHGGVVLVDGYFYGSNWDGNDKGNWVCVEFKTGKTMYETKWQGKGSMIYADGMLYCYDENKGNLALVKATPDAFEIVSSFQITGGGKQHWAHPAISDGRLYMRYEDTLRVYDIKAK